MSALPRPATRRSPLSPRQWVSEALFDFWAGRVHPLWTLRRARARLVSRHAASADAMTLVLRPNRHFHGVAPGQHVNLGVELDGRRLSRSYSPTLLDDGCLAITVKTVAGGKVSQHLAQHAQVGEVFELGQAFGEMTLPAALSTRMLLLAAGSGITPMRALVRQLEAAGMPVQVDLVYWAQQREAVCFADELADIAARHPGFRLHLALTRDPAAPAARVHDYDFNPLGDLSGVHVMACGPGGFVEGARARLHGQVGALQSEAFTPPVLSDAETGTVQVELRRSGRTLELPRGTSLLQALEAEGLRPASGCRMGICNTCVCGKASGVTRHTLTGEYATEPATQVKLCVNSASTDLILEL
ncbi:ferredoxin reductase [Stenotrophomonas sp. ISL-67]|uniref:ferredoxin reductase n=1 Tax=Stenotrophomonas sp. ISL-67 TaxID=2819171 RepID=UPI001BE60AE3|nr:ferredoxin reductase [Stenotrophomonas sp. ISL-67]MBT2766379.1 ferredoxin reductase [Stenotrophomonas sp. ISL-67]